MLDPHRLRRAGVALTAGLAIFPASAFAAPVDLGTADSFGVLASGTVTNTGPSVLAGDLGVHPGAAIVGFPPGQISGAFHPGDATALQAQNDLTTAYNEAAGRPQTAPAPAVLAGTTLAPGVYTGGALALNGDLTLDALGDSNAVWVFKAASTLVAASNSRVLLQGGAQACNVFWQVGSAATIGTSSQFVGNLLTESGVVMQTSATLDGRALARSAAVTLDTNTIFRSACTTGSPTPLTPTPTPGTPTPTPGTPAPPSATAPGGSAAPGGTAAPGTPGGAAAPTGAGGPGGAAAPGTQSPVAAPAPQLPPASRSKVPTRNGTATLRPPARRSSGPRETCTDGFTARVRGRGIDRVVFRLDGKRIASRSGSPFQVYVKGAAGRHNVTARVTFTDATRAKTLSFGYRACASAVLKPRRGPSRFTG